MIDKGAVGTPRVVWRTEIIPTEPTWIKRALHNTIKHNKGVDTYFNEADDYFMESEMSNSEMIAIKIDSATTQSD
jgi:hypothetical protein